MGAPIENGAPHESAALSERMVKLEHFAAAVADLVERAGPVEELPIHSVVWAASLSKLLETLE